MAKDFGFVGSDDVTEQVIRNEVEKGGPNWGEESDEDDEEKVEW